MIKLTNVSKVYPPNVVALDNVSLTIETGEFVSIVGMSGTGKSTLVRLLIAEERPSQGEVRVDDWVVNRINPTHIPFYRRQIGVVFQDFKLLPRKTVFENVAFAMEVAGNDPPPRIERRVLEVLDVVGLRDRRGAFPEQLSGGEQQRIAIARALVHRPKLLIADEPTGNLDVINTKEVISLLEKINDAGTTVIMVTHDPEVVNSLRRHVVTIDGGRVARDVAQGRYVL
ncbi:MAG: cell division ATP-binding protein FtsE [Candidatus Andersenbacteria bacterium]